MDFIKFYRVYRERWFLTNSSAIYKNLLSTMAVFSVCCFAVQKDVFVTYEATKSACFACLMALIWCGIFNSIGQYNQEAYYTNDMFDKNLSLPVYMFSTVSVQLQLCVFQALACTGIFRWFFEYDKEGLITPYTAADYGITFFLILLSADMLGLALGTFVSSIGTALTVIPIALIAQFLLSGSLFELDSEVLKNVSIFTTAKYGFQALGSIADLNSKNLPLSINTVYPQVIKQASDLFDHTKDYITDCWYHLLILSVIGLMISTISLYLRINAKD